MKTSTAIAVVLALVIVVGGAYWWTQSQGGGGYQAPQTPSTTTTTNTNPTGADYTPGNLLLGTDANATLGTYLIASNGMTLYKYTKDTSGVSNCAGQCAAVWPPYTVASTDSLANIQAGVSGKVGSIVRADGSMQVTYNGAPLYFYNKDSVSGDTNGQNVGGVWFVVTP